MSSPTEGWFDFLMRCANCGAVWELGGIQASCRCPNPVWRHLPKGDPNWVSGMCWDGRHHRCTGWMVHGSGARRLRYLVSVQCRCQRCDHPPVHSHRHLKEPPQKGAPWN